MVDMKITVPGSFVGLDQQSELRAFRCIDEFV
uniref:DUF982 domain-containing protein n=1 Tax=Ascaris lumbricoides TaxID=6252 RepID=A0A0M3HHM6_ASCLU